MQPPGISLSGGSDGAAPIRAGGFHGWTGLKPEQATNWGIGFDYTPVRQFPPWAEYPGDLLHHQDHQPAGGLRLRQQQQFQQPATGFVRLSRSHRLAGLGTPGRRGLHQQSGADDLRSVPGGGKRASRPSEFQRIAASPDPDHVDQRLVGTFNKGWQKLDGVDWSASYDWDMGRSRRLQCRLGRHVLSAQQDGKHSRRAGVDRRRLCSTPRSTSAR